MSGLAQQTRALLHVQSGYCEAAMRPTSIIDGRDLVEALRMMVADHKAANARASLAIHDDRTADILDMTAMESAARVRAILDRMGIDATIMTEALL